MRDRNKHTGQYLRRRLKGGLMMSLCYASAILALLPLILIFVYTMSKGAGHLNLDFFIRMPKPVGEAGGGK